MTKVRSYPDRSYSEQYEWVYRYLWVGPKGTTAFRVCLGTDSSTAFLEFIRELRKAYLSTAADLDHTPMLEAAQLERENDLRIV